MQMEFPNTMLLSEIRTHALQASALARRRLPETSGGV